MRVPHLQERFARKNEAAELHRAFTTLDRNHDGVIDADELNALFLDMGHKAKKVRVAATSRAPCILVLLERYEASSAILCSQSLIRGVLRLCADRDRGHDLGSGRGL